MSVWCVTRVCRHPVVSAIGVRMSYKSQVLLLLTATPELFVCHMAVCGGV